MQRTAQPEIDVRTLSAYRDGVDAFLMNDSDCPFPMGISGIQRQAWWTGWLDAQVRRNVGDVLRRRGLSFP